MTLLRFGPTITPLQGDGPRVVCFAATPAEVSKIARIERIARDEDGKLNGFQRPQIAAHIREIREFLEQPDSILPNAIVIGFSDRVSLAETGELLVDISEGPPGWVVDGQQRLCAAMGLPDRPFQFVVSAFLCGEPAELNRQFILINNTKPLAKPLIYELMPGVSGLPRRLSDRIRAALLVEALNYGRASSLRGQICQQTNPDGLLKDTVLQRMLINSIKDGALREFATDQTLLHDGLQLVSDFFAAVQKVFQSDWAGHSPKSSRLVHGVGIIAMGYVMDEIAIRFQIRDRQGFEDRLRVLLGHTRWTDGEWVLGSERRAWNSMQNVQSDYMLISHHLVRLVRRSGVRVEAA